LGVPKEPTPGAVETADKDIAGHFECLGKTWTVNGGRGRLIALGWTHV